MGRATRGKYPTLDFLLLEGVKSLLIIKNKVNILVAPAILFPHGGCSKVEFHSRPWSPYVSSHIIFDSLRFHHNVKCTDTHMHIGEKPESVKGRSWSANLKALFTLIRSVVCIFLYQTQT